MKLKEFSKVLGLSQTTVSRALGGYPEVSEKTRKRVADAALKYGYAPNAHALSLSTGTSNTIACVIPIANQNEIMNPIFGDFMAGVGLASSAHDFDVSLRVVPNESQFDVYRSLKSRSQIGGIILQSPEINDQRIEMLSNIGLPFVVHGRSSQIDLPYSWLDVNNRRAFERVTDFLIDLGHHRIALINGPEGLDFSHRRKSGYEEALKKSEIIPLKEYIISSDLTAQVGYNSTMALLDLPTPPTAIAVSSMIVAWGVKEALEDRGLLLGSDVSVVTFDDALSYIGMPAPEPVFTAVRSSVREAGRKLAAMLISQILSGDYSPQSELLEADLILGKSTRAIRRDHKIA